MIALRDALPGLFEMSPDGIGTDLAQEATRLPYPRLLAAIRALASAGEVHWVKTDLSPAKKMLRVA